MRIILSRRGKRYHSISKAVDRSMKKEAGDEERKLTFQKFYREIACDYSVGHICCENIASAEELDKIVTAMYEMGLDWHDSYYIPVAAFTYSDTFNFLINNMWMLGKPEGEKIKEYLHRFF